MTSRLERAAVALAARLHQGGAHRAELAALEAALQTAPMDREAWEDLPRMLELERRAIGDDPGGWHDYDLGWNDALETATAIVRFVLQKSE